MRQTLRPVDWFWVGSLSVLAVALHGYHLGIEDQTVFLTAVKHALSPDLYPHDSMFFLIEARLTLFDDLVAWTIRTTRLPLDVVVFTWHLSTLLLVLLGCWNLVRRCVPGRPAAIAAVGAVAILLPFPVAGTHLGLMEQYFHPRGLAMAALLAGFLAALDGRVSAVAWLVVAGLIHPMVAVWGAVHVAVQGLRRVPRWVLAATVSAACLLLAFLPIPGAGVDSDARRQLLASDTLRYYFPLRWTWYEWVGAVAPIVLLALMGRRRSADSIDPGGNFSQVTSGLAFSTGLGVLMSVLLTGVGDSRLALTQPMRCLHLPYIIVFLFGAGLIADRVLRRSVGRWAGCAVSLCAAVVLTQRSFPDSPHIEWPGRLPANAWVEAFDWIRQHTSRDALCALNPRYFRDPGSDSHAFRFFAERSALAEAVTDIGPAALSADLSRRWLADLQVQTGWKEFRAADIRRLGSGSGVRWVVLEQPGIPGLTCPFENARVRVCRTD